MKVIPILIFLFTCMRLYHAQQQNVKPFALGITDEIYSTVLHENRILNIYLPVGYQENDSLVYPVIYLLDGSADEDFIHVAGLIQFNNFPWVKRTPPSIVVGIANVDRKRDFTFPTSQAEQKEWNPTSGSSAAFIEFIKKELQPFIRKNYKSSEFCTLIGQSLGGLLATEILLKQPALFDQYIIISPSLWWDNGSLLQQDSEVLKKSFQQVTKVYIGVGKEGLTPGRQPRVMETDANLLADKLKKSNSSHLLVYFDYLPDENHATIGHQAISNALKIFYSTSHVEK